MFHSKKLMKMKKKIINSLFLFVSLAFMDSCTKLEEEILDESSVTGLSDKQLAE